MDMKRKVAEATKKVVEKNIDKEELQKKTLRALAIKEETAKKIGAAAMVGKAVADKEMEVKLNKNINLKVNANKGKESFALFFRKGF